MCKYSIPNILQILIDSKFQIFIQFGFDSEKTHVMSDSLIIYFYWTEFGLSFRIWFICQTLITKHTIVYAKIQMKEKYLFLFFCQRRKSILKSIFIPEKSNWFLRFIFTKKKLINKLIAGRHESVGSANSVRNSLKSVLNQQFS